MSNFLNRIGRLFDAASSYISPAGPSQWQYKGPIQQQDPLPQNASDEERILHGQIKAMHASILPPSIVDELFPVDS